MNPKLTELIRFIVAGGVLLFLYGLVAMAVRAIYENYHIKGEREKDA